MFEISPHGNTETRSGPAHLRSAARGWVSTALAGIALGVLSPTGWAGAQPADAAGGRGGGTQDERPEQLSEDAAQRLVEGRQEVPDFPAAARWLNTARPLRFESLRGKFVLIDFWTYCCINCMHILPELKKLEQQYPNQLVVIGVHSAKFDTEKDAANIAEAVMRYDIEHPVLVDEEMQVWRAFGCSSWPTVLLVDPEGYAVWGTRGETTYEAIAPVLESLIPVYRQRGALDERPVHFELERRNLAATPLRFPGKVLADEAGQRLFISDSGHHRILVASWDGTLLDQFGDGQAGWRDGSADEARFQQPQGLALAGSVLWVADTENHAIRRIDLNTRTVTTAAGIGRQARVPFPADPTADEGGWRSEVEGTALNSPWDLWIDEELLYIAMAGSHQIWRMPLDGTWIEVFAGNGREDIVDGARRAKRPYQLGSSSFAQPSGLTGGDGRLYVADSEGSSIRRIRLDEDGPVATVVGTSELDRGRLFEFGDVDGLRREVRLQHPLGVALVSGALWVADTYNDKLKIVDPETGQTRTAALIEADGREVQAAFNEPGGLSAAGGQLFVADTNAHRIRRVDLASRRVDDVVIAGLQPPSPPRPVFDFRAAPSRPAGSFRARPVDGQIEIALDLQLPEGWKVNPLAPMYAFVDTSGGTLLAGEVDSGHPISIEPPTERIRIRLRAVGTGAQTVRLAAVCYYCQDAGLCQVETIRIEFEVVLDANAESNSVRLEQAIEADR